MKVETIHAIDGGEHMGWLLYGELDDLDVDLFLADVAWDEPELIEDAGPDGFDIVPTWVRKVPINDPHSDAFGGHRYVYASSPGPGASRCARIEPAHVWPHWCMNHIWERASSGHPVEQVKDPIWPMVSVRITSPEEIERHPRYARSGPRDGEAYVYLCGPCSRSFRARVDLARAEHLLAHYESKDDEASARYAEKTRARIAEQRKTVVLMDEIKAAVA